MVFGHLTYSYEVQGGPVDESQGVYIDIIYNNVIVSANLVLPIKHPDDDGLDFQIGVLSAKS